MKKIKKIPSIQVKRAFVTQNLMKISNGKKKFLRNISKNDFEKKLEQAKQKVLKMSEKQLDKFIYDEYPRRHWAYNTSTWYIGEVTPEEVGVWRRAGGLPLSWTNGSLRETANKVKRAIHLNKIPNGRARHVIPNLLKTSVNDIQKEQYLLPVVFEHNTGTRGRRLLKKIVKGDIDDGCMRSISLAVNDAKTIQVYLGFPKDKVSVFPKKNYRVKF